LFTAAREGKPFKVLWLLERGADPNISTSDVRLAKYKFATALYAAIMSGNMDCKKLIIAFGGQILTVDDKQKVALRKFSGMKSPRYKIRHPLLLEKSPPVFLEPVPSTLLPRSLDVDSVRSNTEENQDKKEEKQLNAEEVDRDKKGENKEEEKAVGNEQEQGGDKAVLQDGKQKDEAVTEEAQQEDKAGVDAQQEDEAGTEDAQQEDKAGTEDAQQEDKAGTKDAQQEDKAGVDAQQEDEVGTKDAQQEDEVGTEYAQQEDENTTNKEQETACLIFQLKIIRWLQLSQ
jgi:hypothetical protein